MCPTFRHRWSHLARDGPCVSEVLYDSWTVMLCIYSVDSHLSLALDSKSVQYVCAIPLLISVFLFQYLQIL